jgi:hypothetical protein
VDVTPSATCGSAVTEYDDGALGIPGTTVDVNVYPFTTGR